MGVVVLGWVLQLSPIGKIQNGMECVIRASVVVPFYNSGDVLGACLDALLSQNISRDQYEIIAVDDGSTDGSAEVARGKGVKLLQQENRGAPAARNTGIEAAAGEWIAFTDADCVPSRGWLRALLAAVDKAGSSGPVLGAAGSVAGHPSASSASRFVDLSGGFDTERHLSHPLFPFAPSGSVMYRRDALNAVGGFDERFITYDSCDLHTRLRTQVGGAFVFAKSAMVLHRHRESWGGYWKQQVNYGRGLAQFYVRWEKNIPWSRLREAREWLTLAPVAIAACLPGKTDKVLARRGTLVKQLAQRVGFATTYFREDERARLRNDSDRGANRGVRG
jgi:GT2 family glycosyltransferase